MRLQDVIIYRWQKRFHLTLLNAIGNQYFRYFEKNQAEAITIGGQLTIRWVERDVNKFMNKLLKTNNLNYVVASDTDSIYLKLDKLVEKVCKDKSTQQIVDFLNKALKIKYKKLLMIVLVILQNM